MKCIIKENINSSSVETHKINNYPWDTVGYKPEALVKMSYDDEKFYVRFIGTEEIVRVENKDRNSRVYQDSCMEFFLQPDINDGRYINFEINAIGTSLVQIGLNGAEREFLVNENMDMLKISSTMTLDNIKDFNGYKKWEMDLEIPFEFIKKYFENFDINNLEKIKCNFYKCGDKTIKPHYGCLFPIDYHKPSFHRPEFFREVLLK